MKILLVEDNQYLAQQLADALSVQRYTVDVAFDGLEGWEYLQGADYDLVILDVMLPRLDGVSLCRRIRDCGNQIPILMLTARGTSQDKIEGLDAGADDYLTKPIRVDELGARIRALLRRGGYREASPILSWGDLTLNPNLCEVFFSGQPLALTPKEYSLLELFMRNNQRVYSRQAILDQLWSLSDDLPGEDTVKSHIKGLRQKLKAVGAKDLIETVYGLGYRLNSAYLKASKVDQSHSTNETFDATATEIASHSENATNSGKADLRQHYSILLVDHLTTWADTVFSGDSFQTFRVQVVASLTAVQEALTRHWPDLVMVSLSFEPGCDTVLALLQELLQEMPEIPVLILTDGDAFTDRRSVMGYRYAGFLDRSSPVQMILETLQSLLERPSPENPATLLVVSESMATGQLITSLASPWELQVRVLYDLQALWQSLETTPPDLLILDSQSFSGASFEVCQLLRQDRRWGWLPIMMLGTSTPEEIQKAFTSGADDFASLPIIGPEMVTRILNRLERTQVLRLHPDIDRLTGLSQRSAAIQELNRLIQLAKRAQVVNYFSILSIDNLQTINEQHGYQVGDQVLKQVGQCLLQYTRSGDIVARWGGATIVLGGYGATEQEGHEEIALALEQLRNQPLPLPQGESLRITFSAGVTQYPTHGQTLQALYQAAEAALTTARNRGGNQVVTTSQLSDRAPEITILQGDSDLSQALTQTLQTRGYCVTIQPNSQLAQAALLATAQTGKPQILFLAENIAPDSGLKFLKWLMKQPLNSTLRVLWLAKDTQEAERAIQLGAAEYVLYPCETSAILQAFIRLQIIHDLHYSRL
ncbi:MAG: hypothetical protein B0A82_10810 [Alkalinema sp. CACIAM 70d]|nr:MAG: hypothetical protein B0A82_10810 [Alkalinema sp. CACIAM 70d]